MRADEQAQVEAVVAAIRAHLRAHPQAADSVHGVARWWLGSAHAGFTLQQVQRALDLLVAGKELRRLRLIDGTFLYSQATPTQQ